MPDQSKRNRTIAAFRKAGGDQEVARRFLANCSHADDIIDKPDGGQTSSRRSDDERDMLRAGLVAYGICFGEDTPLEKNVRAMVATLTPSDATALVQVCVPHREQPQFAHHLYRSQERREQWTPEVARWRQIATEGTTQLTQLKQKCTRLTKLTEIIESTLTSLRDNGVVAEMIEASLKPGGSFAGNENDRLIVVMAGRVEQAMCIYERFEAKGREPGYLKVHYLCSAPWNLFDPHPERNRRVRGAGQYALDDAIRRSDQKTATKGHVRLDAMTDNVIAFYERRGFQRLPNTGGAEANIPMELVTVGRRR